MAQGLADALLSHQPRERSGGPSANRVAYHHTWALCQLLRLHARGDDYVLIMEFHDDVLVIDSVTSPTTADFFQVKTRKDGRWTVTDLLRVEQPKRGRKSKPQNSAVPPAPPEAPPQSIFGKLLDHVQHFAPHVRTLNLITNARFNLPLLAPPPSGDRNEIALVDLDGETLERVRSSLQAELSLNAAPPVELVFLLVCGMGLTEHEKHGAGELAAFLEARRPGGRYAVQALFRTLADEIGRRAKNEWQPTSFEDLCRQRGICRADVEKLLLVADRQRDPEEHLREVKEQLRTEGLAYRDITLLAGAWQRYQVQATDHADQALMTLQEQVIGVVTPIASSATWKQLTELLSLAEVAFVQAHGEPVPPFDRSYLRGAILLEYKNIEARGLPTLDPQPTPEAP